MGDTPLWDKGNPGYGPQDADLEDMKPKRRTLEEITNQELMRREMEKSNLSKGMTLDDVFDGVKNCENTLSPYGLLNSQITELATGLVNKHLSEFSAGLKQWRDIQNAIEAGIRLGWERGRGSMG